ncbi:MAG: 2-hydroxychromene-2-carboxylate isomerase, partial [Caulobacterales bacterium]
EASVRGLNVLWRPILLGPIFRDEGLTDSPFNLQPRKGAYMWRDLARICLALEIPFQRVTPFPQNGLLGARVATALSDEQRPRFARALYLREFGNGEQISDEDTIRAALADADCDIDETIEAASAGIVKEQLRAATDEAKVLGVFGAPSFTVGDELFWGNDRLEAAMDWAKNRNDAHH